MQSFEQKMSRKFDIFIKFLIKKIKNMYTLVYLKLLKNKIINYNHKFNIRLLMLAHKRRIYYR